MKLFVTAVPEEVRHPHYISVSDRLNLPEQQVLEAWADGFTDRDGNFVKEFQTKFNQQFWELYLFACLKEMGALVDFSHPAPDFDVQLRGHGFIAEATTMQHADGYRPEWARPNEGPDMDELVRHASIRLMNAISGKVHKYRKSYSSLAHVKGKPFLLCIGAYEQPYFFRQRDRALRRVLYSYNEPLIIEAKDARYLVGHDRISSEVKDGGAVLDLGVFTRPGMEVISAILFSSLATFGKVRALAVQSPLPVLFEALRFDAKSTEPRHIVAWRSEYEETLLDGLHLCINPFAAHPIDWELFEDRPIAIHSYDPATSNYNVSPPDGHLYLRECRVVSVGDNVPHPGEPQASHYKTPKAPDWPDGKLMPSAGGTFLYEDDHIAHYKGWTIHVASDGEDWMAHALRTKIGNLADFVRENQKERVPYCLPAQVFSDKEQARDAMKSAIDRFESGIPAEEIQPIFVPSD